MNGRTFPDESPTHWFQAFTPLPTPVNACAGDAVYLELMIAERDHPSLSYDMLVASGTAQEVDDFLRERQEEGAIDQETLALAA